MTYSVVEFQDPTGSVLVARFPATGTAAFTLGSQLIVEEGQLAVFYRDGRLTDIFRAGRYTLNTNNLPVLSKLLQLGTLGARSPFRAHIYFIQLKTFTNLGWGTPTPILFRDAEYKAVHLRAHGSFSLRVESATRFLKTMVGSQGAETTLAVEEYVRRIILSRLANLLPSKLTSLIDLPARYHEIEATLKIEVRDDIAPSGLALVDLIVEAITAPPEVQEIINRAAGTRAVDHAEVDRYQRIAEADALLAAAMQPDPAWRTAPPVRATPPAPRPASGSDDSSANPPDGHAAAIDRTRAKLRQLKSLLEEGLITQEDFEQQKKRWLDQL